MKRAIFSLFFLLLSFSPLSASAAPNIDSCSIEKLSDGSYFETIITSDSSAPTEYSRSNGPDRTESLAPFCRDRNRKKITALDESRPGLPAPQPGSFDSFRRRATACQTRLLSR